MLQPLKELKLNLIKGVFAKEHNFNHSTAFNEVSFNMKLKIIIKKNLSSSLLRKICAFINQSLGFKRPFDYN